MTQKEIDLLVYGNYFEDKKRNRVDPLTVMIKKHKSGVKSFFVLDPLTKETVRKNLKHFTNKP